MNVPGLKYDWSSVPCSAAASGESKCEQQKAAGVTGEMTENSNSKDGYRCRNRDEHKMCDMEVAQDPGLCDQAGYKSGCCVCGGGDESHIDGRYVDGFSITSRKDADAGRDHVFTLAVGAMEEANVGVDGDNFVDYAKDPADQGALVQEKCWATESQALAKGCYLGNCGCHGGDAIHR